MTIEEFVTGSAFPNMANIADTYLQSMCWIDKDKGITFTVNPKEKDGNRIIEGVWHTKDSETSATISLKGKVYRVSPDMSTIELLKIEHIAYPDTQMVPLHNRDLRAAGEEFVLFYAKLNAMAATAPKKR